MNIVIRVLCLAFGYLFGLIQTAYIYGRCNGIDIRTQGSGNAGTTNALRVLGKKAGIIVFFGDFFKAFVACLLARLLAQAIGQPEHVYIFMFYAGLGAVLGHNFPCYLNFKGGKGIASTAGFVVGLLEWKLIIPCFFIFVIVVAISRYVSLGSLVVVSSVFVLYVIYGQLDMLVWGNNFSDAILYESYAILFCFVALAFYRHKENIVRLVKGEEHKLWGSKKAATSTNEEDNSIEDKNTDQK